MEEYESIPFGFGTIHQLTDASESPQDGSGDDESLLEYNRVAVFATGPYRGWGFRYTTDP